MANILTRAVKALRMRVGLDDNRSIMQHMGLLSNTLSGASITEQTSLSLSTVYACTYKISSTMASIGLDLFKKEGRNTEKIKAHPAYRVVVERPNEYQTAFEFWETIIANAVLGGVGYALIDRSPNGTAQQLIIIPNDQVERVERNDRVIYKIKDNIIVQPEDMLEICNMYRMSPVRLHRENLGLSKSAQDYGAEYFGNGGQMTGVLSSEQPLKSEQMEVIQRSWNHSSTSAGTKLLPFGFKYSRISIAPEEAQFIETRKFQAEEICRIFSVPPALVQLESQTTYNNVEQQNLQFARHTIAPWAKRIEQEIDKKLLTTFERSSDYFKFNLNDLFRGDMVTRAGYYTQLLQNGVMSINEVREREELNPTNGGDVHTVQVNQIALDRLGAYSDKISSDETGQ